MASKPQISNRAWKVDCYNDSSNKTCYLAQLPSQQELLLQQLIMSLAGRRRIHREIVTPRSLNSSHMNSRKRLSRPLAARTIFSNGQA
ncbi:hypothetical protein TNCV_762051 [Trichonephila clavipes]|nr:hypothetical protein TNCV_762051 [Trichonephila clavipes]